MIEDTLKEIFTYTWPMIILVVNIISSVRIVYLFTNKKKIILYEELIGLSFIIYILSLFYVVTFQDINYGNNNYVFFKEMMRYPIHSKMFIKNVLGNILLFIPLGFYVTYYLKSKKIGWPFLLIAFFSVTIEVIQLKIGRVFDVDDILLNIFGGIIGYTFYKLNQYLPKFMHKKWFLNAICIIIILLFVLYILKAYNMI